MVEVKKKHPRLNARVTTLKTSHGDITTPAFMPVGTYAAVNCMTVRDLSETGSQIILGGNTYHMLVNPGMDFIQDAGGMHALMGWQQPMLTDSGGFQVFSLSKREDAFCKIDENGARFKHPVTGKIIPLNAKTSIEAQKIIGADIIMAFDQCTPEVGGKEMAIKAMERTHRWLLDSIEVHERHPNSAYGFKQQLFGIVQGGSFRDLREQSAEFIMKANLDGIAIGGESIGFDMEKTRDILQWIVPSLPEDKARYTMGVGLQPEDLIDVVAEGVDIFDCVAPTRNARHGSLYCGRVVPDGDWVKFVTEESRGRILIKRGVYAKDNDPIMKDCDCYTCQHFSRAYLHYLCKARLPLFLNLACIHNVRVMHQACEAMRTVIAAESAHENLT
ncbi:MAG: tRNA guanosine(34) transglycosylase Tgt [Gammaproteobacteria bacterium]